MNELDLNTHPTRFRRRKKRQVVSHIKEHGSWEGYLCPSKAYPRPDHPFNLAIAVEFTKEMMEYEYPGAVVTPFERVIGAFSHYNLTAETGRYIHYYEEWEDDQDESEGPRDL